MLHNLITKAEFKNGIIPNGDQKKKLLIVPEKRNVKFLDVTYRVIKGGK